MLSAASGQLTNQSYYIEKSVLSVQIQNQNINGLDIIDIEGTKYK